MSKFHKCFATWFGLGFSPKAPGTMGSLGTLPMIALILWFVPLWPSIHVGIFTVNAFALLAIGLFFAAIPSVEWMIRQFACEDPQMVVIDEVAGLTLTFAFIDTSLLRAHPWILLLGFALFRFFDILKPLGIRRIESLPGAWGVMADDMLGGIYAGMLLTVATLAVT
jgi:phosphatidylglycerophosphatase A